MKAITIAALLASLLGTSAAFAQDDEDRTSRTEREQVVAASAVPEFVMTTFQSEVPGAFVMRVMKQVLGDDTTRYRFDASQVGRYWVVVVRDDGELIEKYESAGPPELG
ncbi:MAG: hypothetical protein AAGI24_16390 [Pseudomonadota bacterium]